MQRNRSYTEEKTANMNKSATTTKKGPGRYHVSGHKKAKQPVKDLSR